METLALRDTVSSRLGDSVMIVVKTLINDEQTLKLVNVSFLI